MPHTAGIPSRPNVAPRPLCNIAEYSVNALRSGTLKDLDFLATYRSRADVLYANALAPPGSKVGAEGGPSRAGGEGRGGLYAELGGGAQSISGGRW